MKDTFFSPRGGQEVVGSNFLINEGKTVLTNNMT